MDSETEYAHFVYRGLSYADMAHVLLLEKGGVIPEDAARTLLSALRELHDQAERVIGDKGTWGDVYDHRDAALQEMIGETAGWLHAARARREAINLGWLIECKQRAVSAIEAAGGLMEAVLACSEAHGKSLMPDFTYLQHAHPTTLGHYLLGFAYPLFRDGIRLMDGWRSLDSSPAGSVSTNGSRFDLDRSWMAEALGFSAVIPHNRDAMWQPDLSINIMGNLVSVATNLDRLIEELFIWSSSEFNFFESSDAHCRTSVIMPHKKNPYALAHLRGSCRLLTADFVAITSSNQTISGQVDNRLAAYRLVPGALGTIKATADLLGEIITEGRFNTEEMKARVGTGYGFATELADLVMSGEGVPARQAHRLVGSLVAALNQDAVRDLEEMEEYYEQSFRKVFSRPPVVPWGKYKKMLSPEEIVMHRVGEGSCHPEEVSRMVNELRELWTKRMVEFSEEVESASFPSKLQEEVENFLERKNKS